MPYKGSEAARARSKRYNEAHREEQRAYSRAYALAHREDRNAYSKAYYGAHREQRRACARRSYAAVGKSHRVRLAGETVNLASMPPELRELGLLLKKARRVIQASQTGALTP